MWEMGECSRAEQEMYEREFEKEHITKDYIEKHPEIITKYLDEHPGFLTKYNFIKEMNKNMKKIKPII